MPVHKLPKLSRAELDIMQVIWQLKEATVTDVAEQINVNRKRKLQRSTIQVQLQRLEEKGWLKHREANRKFLYFTRYSQDQVSAEIVNDIAERVFNGSSSSMLLCMFNNRLIDSADIEKLKSIIDSAEGGKGDGKS